MIYSEYTESDLHSSKWDRVRVNHDLVKRVIAIRESTNSFNTNNQFNQPKTLNDGLKLQSSLRTGRQ